MKKRINIIKTKNNISFKIYITIFMLILLMFLSVGIPIFYYMQKPERKFNFPKGSTNIVYYTKNNFRYDLSCERIYIYDRGWGNYEVTKIKKIKGCK